MEALSTLPAIGFHCVPIEGGFSWSLTSLLGRMLADAEQRYGPRDKSWTILGIEFCEVGPRVWFPGNRRHVSILLSNIARENPIIAQYELAQEIVHLLAPNGGGPAPVIEEGVATIFANEWVKPMRVSSGSYSEAEKLAQTLLTADPMSIKILREKRLNFFDFTPKFIRDHYPIISEPEAAALCERFQQ